jgi:hypothetical protein
MPTVCDSCGDEVDTTYDCRECGDAYCIDCRLPADHECESIVNQEDETGPEDPLESMSFSMPSGPRIELLLPVWKRIPWQVPIVLIGALFPISMVVGLQALPPSWFVFSILGAMLLTVLLLGLSVYHERLLATADDWHPSGVYYFPIVILFLSVYMSNVGGIVAAGGTYFFALAGAIVFTYRKRQ